jgi:hypothetical protein
VFPNPIQQHGIVHRSGGHPEPCLYDVLVAALQPDAVHLQEGQAEKVLRLTGSSSELVYKPLPGDDPIQRCPVIDLAKEKLNWEPRVKLDEGLEKTIAYFRSCGLT